MWPRHDVRLQGVVIDVDEKSGKAAGIERLTVHMRDREDYRYRRSSGALI